MKQDKYRSEQISQTNMSTSTSYKIPINQCPCCKSEEIYCNCVSNHKHLFNCITCGVYFFVDRPTVKELENHYTTTYSNVHNEQLYNLLKANYDSGFFTNQVKDCLTYLNSHEKTKFKILDYGSSYGFFLKTAKDMGLDAYGMEYDKKISDYNEKEFGINMIPPDKLDVISNETFDIIRANHVVEHLIDPRETLTTLFGKLQKNGIIVISSPSFSDKIIQTNALRLSDFVYPEHLFYFTKRSMEEMLKQIGFDLEVNMTQFANNQQALRLLGIKHDYASDNVNKLCKILESEPFFAGANLFVVARKTQKQLIHESTSSNNEIYTHILEQYFRDHYPSDSTMKTSDNGASLINIKENGNWQILFPVKMQNGHKGKLFVSGNILTFESNNIHVRLLSENKETIKNESLIMRDSMLNSFLLVHDLESTFYFVSFSGDASTKFLIYDLIATKIVKS